MIIKEIHIDGFGIFNGFSLKNLKQGINIIIGNNEVGKSTILKFLRYTLFGYPRFKDQRMSPVNGGNHGGRIKSIISSNKEAIFERTGGDQISLHYDGRNSQNETLWFQLLGNATKEIFENVYAFSLDELVGMQSLSSSGVEDKIFSVSFGLGNISIGDVETDILNNVNDIYTPRGSKQLIPVILKEVQNKKSQLHTIQDNLPIYQNLTSQINILESEITGIETLLNENRNEKEKLDNYLKCYKSFISIINIDKELENLPEFQNYNTNGLEQLGKLEEEEKRLNEKIQELQNGNEDEKGIDELEGEIDSISFNKKLLENPEKVEYLRTNLELYKRTVSEKIDGDGKIENFNKNIDQELNSISSEWTEQNIIEFTDDLTHKNKIYDFKKEFEKIENDRRDLEARKNILQSKEGVINTNTLFILLSLISVLGSIPAFSYSLPVLGAICLIIACLLFFGRKYIIKESLLCKVQEQLSDNDTRKKELTNEYEKYLENNLKLEKTLSIESVLEVLNSIKPLKKNINDLDELKRKQDKERIPFIDKFKDEVKSITDFSGIQSADDNIEILVNEIIQEFDSAEKQSQNKETLQSIFSGKQKELTKTQKKLKNNEQLIAQLLKSINATDREDFRKKYEVNNQVKNLSEDRKSAVMTIETIVGLGKADGVIDFLQSHEQQDLRDKVNELEVVLTEKSKELKLKNEELGEKKNEIKRIEGESELAGIMTELESERQKLRDAYKEWITNKIALKLLNDVKEEYEKEKQPVVIKNSSTYFNKITEERYKRISVSLGEKDITIFDPREASKKIDQLSRGTKEQLLISLRLGFIEEYETKTESLPVIVDEILVNFDKSRAKKAAGIFQDFAKDRQILLFTCHPSTIEYFEKSSINKIELNK